MTNSSIFYTGSRLSNPTPEAILAGQVVRINPALITLIDGRVENTLASELQQEVLTIVRRLLDHKIRTFHVDINFEDYSGFGTQRPDINTGVFTPAFVRELVTITRPADAFINLHLLTDDPEKHIDNFKQAGAGAVCFQLDVISDSVQLAGIIKQIREINAVPSPVIETVGTDNLIPQSPAKVRKLLHPHLSDTGMLTLQAAGTASRSNIPAGSFNLTRVAAYLDELRPGHRGTVQVQGGIKTGTVAPAVKLGAEFLVCGTQIFHSKEGHSPEQIIDTMLQEAAAALAD